MAGWQPARYSRAEPAVTVSRVVDALEEGEGLWVWRLRRIQRVSQSLHRHVCMTDDLATLEGLRCSVAGGLLARCFRRSEYNWPSLCRVRVCEAPCHEILHLHCDAEGRVGFDFTGGARFWKSDDG